jgi:3-oxoacyl-[acyl-carrier-protein] synthase-1
MQPLLLSHFSIISSLGTGLGATLDALRAGRSGLRPQSYTGAVDTWTGHIDALDTFRLDPQLAAFECRNNRLAALALAQDGFADAVEALREK